MFVFTYFSLLWCLGYWSCFLFREWENGIIVIIDLVVAILPCSRYFNIVAGEIRIHLWIHDSSLVEITLAIFHIKWSFWILPCHAPITLKPTEFCVYSFNQVYQRMSDDFFADGTWNVVDLSPFTYLIENGLGNRLIHFPLSVSNGDVDVPTADNMGTVNEVH